jgi:hypothetical protein
MEKMEKNGKNGKIIQNKMECMKMRKINEF